MFRNLRLLLFGVCQLSLAAFVSSGTYAGESCTDSYGKHGTCKDYRSCPAAAEGLKRSHRPKICSFSRRDPIICCAMEEEEMKPQPVVNSKTKPGDKAQYCPIKWVLLGTEVTRSATDPASPSARRGQIHIIVRRISHPGYRNPSKYDDVALLEIGPALEPDALELASQELHPACLPINQNDSPPNIISTGWEREKTSQYLIKVERNIVSFSVCNETYGVYKRPSVLSRGIDETMICADVLGGDDDPCLISSGGPLQVPIKETCMYEIWGISSFGILCDVRNYPHVYMRVFEYVPWIESIVWP